MGRNVEVVFKFEYEGKEYGFKIDGVNSGFTPDGEIVHVYLPEEKTRKLLDSIFNVVDRRTKIGD